VQLCGTDKGGKQGANWAEKVVNVEFALAHKSEGLNMKMSSTLNEDFNNESWGIRDFFLFAGLCHKHCSSCTGPGPSDCTSCGRDHILDNGMCREGGNWYIIGKFFMNDETDFANL
jgi:hypothetical protein